MAVDVPIRILGFGITALGGAFFLISVPFTAFSGNVGDAWDGLVKEPAEYTFVRPLGVFDSNPQSYDGQEGEYFADVELSTLDTEALEHSRKPYPVLLK